MIGPAGGISFPSGSAAARLDVLQAIAGMRNARCRIPVLNELKESYRTTKATPGADFFRADFFHWPKENAACE
jgi:hypothetical protein